MQIVPRVVSIYDRQLRLQHRVLTWQCCQTCSAEKQCMHVTMTKAVLYS
jgi:hypothetical protein